jgi:hypothetical protein
MFFWAKSRFGRAIESAAWALDLAIGFGLLSGAAVAVAVGKFALGGVLAAVACGVLLRYKRSRLNAQKRGKQGDL